MANTHPVVSGTRGRRPDDEGSKYIFAYGSLLSPTLMTQTCPSASFYARASLPNYEVQFRVPSDTGQGGISGIVAAPGRLTIGVIYEVDNADVARLDMLEGVDKGIYRRDGFLVLSEDGQWHEAALYRPTDPPDAQIDPAPFYLDHMIEGARAHDMDAEFVTGLVDWRGSLG